jgi:hypothetical protein
MANISQQSLRLPVHDRTAENIDDAPTTSSSDVAVTKVSKDSIRLTTALTGPPPIHIDLRSDATGDSASNALLSASLQI